MNPNNLPIRMWEQVEVDLAVRLRREGKSIPFIAKRIGRTVRAVTDKFRQVGVSARSAEWTRAQFEHLQAHKDRTDAELSDEISRLGPFRSPEAAYPAEQVQKFVRLAHAASFIALR